MFTKRNLKPSHGIDLQIARIGHGAHSSRSPGHCVMEAAGLYFGLSNDEKTDGPGNIVCHEQIRSLMIHLNDNLPFLYRQHLREFIPYLDKHHTGVDDEEDAETDANKRDRKIYQSRIRALNKLNEFHVALSKKDSTRDDKFAKLFNAVRNTIALALKRPSAFKRWVPEMTEADVKAINQEIKEREKYLKDPKGRKKVLQQVQEEATPQEVKGVDLAVAREVVDMFSNLDDDSAVGIGLTIKN